MPSTFCSVFDDIGSLKTKPLLSLSGAQPLLTVPEERTEQRMQISEPHASKVFLRGFFSSYWLQVQLQLVWRPKERSV
jgi:hypothetical protein